MRIPSRRHAALALALVLGVGSIAPASAAEFGASVGASVGAPQLATLQSLEGNIGRSMNNTRLFFKWDNAFPNDYVNQLKSTHRLMISVQAVKKGGTRLPWSAIASAQPGSPLHNDMVRWARGLRDLQVPVHFTFNHEPEVQANAASGTATDFIAAWRTFRSIIEAEGATNVSFLWILTSMSFRVGSADRRYAPTWYPGDDYVDAIGSDAYNWYNCRTNVRTPWYSLAYLIEGQRKFGLAHPTKPLYITEWASAEDAAMPGRKAQWITDARIMLQSPGYEQFRGATYFNVPGQGSCVWDVRSSESSLQAFTEMGQDPYFQDAPSVS